MDDGTVYYSYTKSPQGDVLVARTEAGLTRISFQEGAKAVSPGEGWVEEASFLRDAHEQLHAYFYGELVDFDLPLAPSGTDFQKKVWDALCAIPCGEVVSYLDIAKAIGQPTATRAVASANGRNPLPIVIPCHRVIGSDGKLRGYAGGLVIKAALLDLEQRKGSAGRSRGGIGGQLSFG